MERTKGFTLVEIIVALAIFSIIIGGSASLILSGSDVFRKNVDMSHAARMSQYTIDWLEDELTFATNISVVTNDNQSIDSGVSAIRIGKSGPEKGHLLRHSGSQWEEVFTSGFYENFKVLIDVESDASDRLSLNVEVQNGMNETIHRTNKIVSFPNDINLTVEDALVSSYPVILYSNEVTITPTEPSGFQNTPTQFAIGGNPKYVVTAEGSLNDYFYKHIKEGDPGVNIPDMYIHYDLEGYVTSTGEVLQGDYYYTRDGQYLTYAKSERPWPPKYPPLEQKSIYDFLYDSGGNLKHSAYINNIVDLDGPDYREPNNDDPDPNKRTKAGDIKKVVQNGEVKLFIFYPYSQAANSYSYPDWWQPLQYEDKS